MSNKYMDSTLLDNAIVFAVKAHANTERRGKGFPYIVHPMEAVSIVATITNDQELLAAAALHDVVEDTDTTIDQIRAAFGDRVAALVADESEPDHDDAPWHKRKQDAIDHLARASRDSKTIAMGDKLSNMRAIAIDYRTIGDKLWSRFHESDPAEHAWHYRGLAQALEELADTEAYQEFVRLIDEVFPRTLEAAKTKELVDALPAEGVNGIDLDAYTDISYGSLRVLFRARQDGRRFFLFNARHEILNKLATSGLSNLISTCNRPEPIPINRFDESGGGFCGKSYDGHDGETMIKMYDKEASVTTRNEQRMSRNVLQMGISTPIPGPIITDGQRTGVLFERIKDKKSFARAISVYPEKLEEYAKGFAKMCAELHSTPCDTLLFNNLTDECEEAVRMTPGFDENERQRLLDILHSTPVEHTCLHGDMHIGNTLITPDGNTYWIDLPTFGYGSHFIDLGTLYLMAWPNPEEITQYLYHISNEQFQQVWNIFLPEYMRLRNLDCSPESVKNYERTCRQYAAVCGLKMIYSVGHDNPCWRDLAKKVVAEM